MGEPMALHLARAGTPLVVWSRRPPAEAVALGHGGLDMSAVVTALEARTAGDTVP